MLFGIGAAEQVALADRLTSVGRTDGQTRSPPCCSTSIRGCAMVDG